MIKSKPRDIAKAAGEKSYIPAKPCRRGHSLRKTSNGECIACKQKWIKENAEKQAAARKRRQPTVYESARRMFNNARARATDRGKEFSLELDDILQLHEDNCGKCVVTGITFTREHNTGMKAAPCQMSIDRIDSTKGYVQGNVQLVCWFYNMWKSQMTHDELFALIKHIPETLR